MPCWLLATVEVFGLGGGSVGARRDAHDDDGGANLIGNRLQRSAQRAGRAGSGDGVWQDGDLDRRVEREDRRVSGGRGCDQADHGSGDGGDGAARAGHLSDGDTVEERHREDPFRRAR